MGCVTVVSSMVEGWELARELKKELKAEWVELWKTKYYDEVMAEGVSNKEFERLFVDRGEVIVATRDFKPLSFKEILEKHLGSNLARKVNPDPAVGGWRKFARDNLKASKPVKRRERPRIKIDLSQPQRKGGKGWLNKARTWGKIRPSKLVY